MRMIQKKAQFPNRVKVAAYARVSSSTDMAFGSLSEQTEYYDRLIKSNPAWTFAGIYFDQGISGTTKTARKGFTTLLEEADKGNIDLILTKSISRFARNTVDLLEATRHLKSIGVSVRFERENIDTSSIDGELMLSLLAAFAEAEAESASETRRWSVRKRYAEGISCHGHPPYGYRWQGPNLVVFPEEAEIVKRIFELYLDGNGTDRIASIITKRGIVKRNGTIFYGTDIRYLLTNETYIGDMILQKKFRSKEKGNKVVKNEGQLPRYLVENDHEAIIDKTTFRKVQEELKRKSTLGRNNLHSKHVPHNSLTSKIICSHCGKHYIRNGKVNGYWICVEKIMHGKDACKAKNISDRVIKSILTDILAEEATEKLILEKIENIQAGFDSIEIHLKDGASYLVHIKSKTGIKATWEIERL